MTYLLPLLLGLAHGVSDASAGLLVGLIIQQRSPEMNTLILLYNLVAFGLQPLAGMLIDRIQQPRRGAAAGLLLSLTGLLITPVNLNMGILLIGSGSACLHAGGGSVAITSAPGKAAAAGVFAAFGVVGLTLGGLASINASANARLVLILLLLILAVIIWFTPQFSHADLQQADQYMKPIASPVSVFLLILLVIAIALRSTVWVGTQMGVARYSSAALWLAVAAGAGKLLGGFAADHFGWKRWMLVALVGAGLLLVFADQAGTASAIWLPTLMLGALMLQSVTPLSIAAMGQALPKAPALAASLVLGTAIIAGGLPFFMLAGGWFWSGVTRGFTWYFSVPGVVLLGSMLLYWYVLKKNFS
jgi:FSR family fosmidomycin resistance protein-like MFS transporter